MQKNLVIVESPAKAKTIEKFLGDDFKVMSSYGHIRDLKKKEISIDMDTLQPSYEIPEEKVKVVKELKANAKSAEKVWLASDEDREGESISWHLCEVLGLDEKKTSRIVFHEITKPAILEAIKNPRHIDMNLVNAQQARRVLDRIVGFKLSPVLWRKVKPALSAGRVQSVAVRLIVEREREIQNFKSESYYRVSAIFAIEDKEGAMSEVKAELPVRFKSRDEVLAFLEKCEKAEFKADSVSKKPLKRSPAPPFTTSTLQQEAARKLGFTVSQTMTIAQHLYENGKITYMRTDSVNLSALCINGSKEEICNLWGEKYSKPRQFHTQSKGAQEAHEAIRPTDMSATTIEGRSQEKRLYELIWKRTIASQMADAEIEKTTVNISGTGLEEQFVANGEVVKFDGFIKVYHESTDDDDQLDAEGSRMLPPISEGQPLLRREISALQRYTQSPMRYTEASLVHKLEELGIGRPSTYAPTISTIQQREYVAKGDKPGEERKYNILTLTNGRITDEERIEATGAEKNKLLPTDIGMVVNDFLIEYFPGIMDYNFTASVEKQFDEIAEGDAKWTNILKQFYSTFHPSVLDTMQSKSEHKVGERMLGTDPQSGRPVSVKIGRFGPVAQIGSATDKEKPRFASLKQGQSIETITLDEVLELFKLPRTLGTYDNHTVTIGMGRFGLYIHCDKLYVSLPKDSDPLEMTLDEAVALIKQKQDAEAQRHIKRFDEEPELEIMNGRYGPYIAYKGNNYKIPKDIVPADLSLASCLELVRLQDEKKASEGEGKKRPTARRTATSKAKK